MFRRSITTIVLSLAIAMAGAFPATARHGTVACDWHWWSGTWHVKQLVKCAANTHGVSVATSLRVADCESDFRPGLYYAGNAGVYQHRVKYWAGRAATYGFDGWSVYNGRANIYVTMRMVRDGGWSPWSCY